MCCKVECSKIQCEVQCIVDDMRGREVEDSGGEGALIIQQVGFKSSQNTKV